MQADITFHTLNSQQINALKAIGKALRLEFEVTPREKSYNPEFVAKIEKSKKQVQEGKTTRVAMDDLDNFLGL